MEKVIQKITISRHALEALQESIELFEEYDELFIIAPSRKNEQLFLGMRDSMIQRFEYCTDLFWKVLKFYLEDFEKVDVAVFSPRAVVRDAVNAKVLKEDEGTACMRMVEARNKTSHIYHQTMAEEIAAKVPDYYLLMKNLITQINNKVK